jgi:hypothetical protein
VAPRTVTWEELTARLADIERHTVRVGVFAAGPGGQLVDGGELTMLGLAAVHELGLGGVPQRSFIRAGIEHHAGAIAKVQEKLVRKIFAGEIGGAVAAETLGQYAVGRIRDYVLTHPLDGAWANAPSTIVRKGSDRPLVDTGRLMASISYQVVSA